MKFLVNRVGEERQNILVGLRSSLSEQESLRRNKAGIEPQVRIETNLGKGLQPVNYWTYIDVRRFGEIMRCGREQYALGFVRYILYSLFPLIGGHVLQNFYAG